MDNKTKINLLTCNFNRYEKNLLKNPKNDNCYYVMAGEYLQLYILDPDMSLLDKALNSYNKALEISTENKLYLVNRAKLHLLMSNFGLAIKDLSLVGDYFNDSSEHLCIKIILKNIFIEYPNLLNDNVLKNIFKDEFYLK